MKTTLFSLILFLSFHGLAIAQYSSGQQGHNFITPERLDMYYGQLMFRLVATKEIQEELEIVDHQIKEISELVSNSERRHSARNKDLFKLKTELDVNEIQKRGVENAIESQKEIVKGIAETSLLPHQVSELKRLMRWVVIDALGSFDRFFQTREVKEKLDIDDSQLQLIKNNSQELQKKFEKDVRDLQEEYRRKLIETLSKEQQGKLKGLLGKPRTFSKLNVKF